MGRDPVRTRAGARRFRPGRFTAAVPVLCLIACTPGCDDDEQYQTVAALQEQNRLLREQVETLERELSERQADRQAGETVTASALREANAEFQKRLAVAGDDKQAALADAQGRHRAAVAQLQGEIASLRLELGAAQRERLTLREMLDSEPRVRQARAEQATFANMTMFLLFLCACALLAFMAVRYRAARDRLNLLTMQSVSQLRFLPGGDQ